jgi:hypothetical protein
MARFELVLSIAKRNDNNELYTEDREYMCYCKDPRDIKEITETVNEIVHEEFEESIEGEVLFGSADIIINESTVLVMSYKNTSLPSEEINTIMDLLIDGPEQETIH